MRYETWDKNVILEIMAASKIFIFSIVVLSISSCKQRFAAGFDVPNLIITRTCLPSPKNLLVIITIKTTAHSFTLPASVLPLSGHLVIG
jgi:hypothetical protein